MKAIKYLICVFLLLNSFQIFPQDQNILIFDPNGVSSSFQFTLSQLTEDSVFVVDSLDDSIFNYDAAFLFIINSNTLIQVNVERLINYTSTGKPTYIFSQPGMDSTTAPFWNHIGLYDFVWLLISSLIDSVEGINTTFTDGIVIDISFMSGGIPATSGTLSPILIGRSAGPEIFPTYKSTVDTLEVILDLYNLIDDYSFLERVLQEFGLIPYPANVQINFFPPVDTALVQGGCTTPEFICKNLTSTNERDSISIEPGFNTNFYYIDSSGYPISLDNYYFIVIDSLDEYEYEVWFHPKSYPPFDPVLIEFDSLFYTDQNNFNLQLIVKKQGLQIAEFTQPFHADFGLGVDDEEFFIKDFNLSQNFPNPFNPVTSIQYVVGSQSEVTLNVYDVLGKEIETLINEQKPSGTYEVEFDATNLPSGIYLYQLNAGSYTETKKMILLK